MTLKLFLILGKSEACVKKKKKSLDTLILPDSQNAQIEFKLEICLMVIFDYL